MLDSQPSQVTHDLYLDLPYTDLLELPVHLGVIKRIERIEQRCNRVEKQSFMRGINTEDGRGKNKALRLLVKEDVQSYQMQTAHRGN